jgi:hypothetical protein
MHLRAVWLVLLAVSSFACGGATQSAPHSSGEAEVHAESRAQAEEGYGYEFDDQPMIAQEMHKSVGPGESAQTAPASAPQPQLPGADTDARPDAPQSPVSVEAPGRRPLLIYTATLTLAVFETSASIDAVQKLAESQKGYLVRRTDTNITIRVPSETFQQTLDAIAKEGDELHREVNVKDITEEFNDLTIRLHNAEVMLARLEQLLGQAKDVKEALLVEHEIERVSATIETIKGKLKLYRELIAFSTITVQYQAKPTDKVSNDVRLPFGWLDELGLPELLRL